MQVRDLIEQLNKLPSHYRVLINSHDNDEEVHTIEEHASTRAIVLLIDTPEIDELSEKILDYETDIRDLEDEKEKLEVENDELGSHNTYLTEELDAAQKEDS